MHNNVIHLKIGFRLSVVSDGIRRLKPLRLLGQVLGLADSWEKIGEIFLTQPTTCRTMSSVVSTLTSFWKGKTVNLSNAILSSNFDRNETETLIERGVERILDGKIKLLANGDSNTKLAKNVKSGVDTLGLSLAPSTIAGCGNLCPFASDGCKDACLYFCGRGGAQNVQAGRIARTIVFRHHRTRFLELLHAELERAQLKADKQNKLLAARLNVLSDVPWESLGVVDAFPRIQFYDYSKWPTRFGAIRPNYWVTFSLSESNEADAINVLSNGGNVAIPFADSTKPFVGNRAKFQRLPKAWKGFKVIDGDETDLRFADTRGRKWGRVVGLRLKALSNADRAEAISSGFAVEFK